METVKLIISDETLRDGEQQAGIFFEYEVKETLARLIARTGVHQMAIMPAIHRTEENLVKKLVVSGLGDRVVASTMLDKQYIDRAIACGVRHIILFYALSDRLLYLRDARFNATYPQPLRAAAIAQIRNTARAKILDNLLYAKSAGLQVYFAAEDASRADFDFLVECINTFQPYLEYFLLCDTVGMLLPEKTYIWLRDLIEYTDNAPLAVHFHNDLGLALENTIQAIRAGAVGISGTFGGIGERAGNVALEQVLNGLRLRFGWEVAGIDYDALDSVTNYLKQLGVSAYPPYSAQAQRYETGIHVHSLMRDRSSYSLFPHRQPEIWFGKCSGASNFQYLFEHYLHQPLTKKQYERLRCQIKTLAIRERRSFSTEEVLELIKQGILQI